MESQDPKPSDLRTEDPDRNPPPIAPDGNKKDRGHEFDAIVTARGYQTLPVVGIGGSAGSLPALQAFFQELPDETGMAFVLILHLSPEHESLIASRLQQFTKMEVCQATDGLKLLANVVYVIPPGKHLALSHGHLQLTESQPTRGKRTAVDLFFRTLADTHGRHATAIILSGSDGDGSAGIKRIKERGGLTIAQDPSEAEHAGMPRSAINSGMVDWVLPAAKMPKCLVDHHHGESRLDLAAEESVEKLVPPEPREEAEPELQQVLSFVRMRTGRDFSYYKPATVLRRISRRMQVNATDNLADYLSCLRTHPGEAGALLQDLLIPVTQFFRDQEAFQALKNFIPELFKGKTHADTVRVWTPACATGEEAYSLAMLLNEHASTLEAPPGIQIFATDLAEEVIQTAREGIYPESIQADVSADRLHRFFIRDEEGYRVRRDLRESVLFAVHDLLKDSPFSRLDLISCRNLLIYLNAAAQERAIDTFHFSLLPGKLLFLGTSEFVNEGRGQFSVVDKSHRLFRQVPLHRSGLPVPSGPGALARATEAQTRTQREITVPKITSDPTAHSITAVPCVPWSELHFKLLEHLGPPSVLINSNYDILHLSENAGEFLQFVGGEPTTNLLGVVSPEVRVSLRATLFQARQSGGAVEAGRLAFDISGERRSFSLRVMPAGEYAPGLYLVIFDDRSGRMESATRLLLEREPLVAHLEDELEQMRSYLHNTVEQHKVSIEELQASNEELHAVNEELRSATEELETNREELQSVNEELSTLNTELKSKVEQLATADSDLHNLMGATAIATIFLDRDLRITRYTLSAVGLFRLIPSDVGRPLTDLQHQLPYPDLGDDAHAVLETLTPVQREIADADGRWFLSRLLPYRSTENHIEGLVLTCFEITDRVRAEAALRESEARLRRVTNVETVGVIFFDITGTITEANEAFLEMSGYSVEDVFAGHLRLDMITQDGRLINSLDPSAEFRTTGRMNAIEREYVRRDGTKWWALFTGALIDAEEGVGYVVDITEHKRTHAGFVESQERLRLVVDNASEYAILSTDLARRVTSWNRGAGVLLGYTEAEIIGNTADIIFTPEDRAQRACEMEADTALATGRAADERWHLRKDQSRFWGSGVMTPMHAESGEVIGFVKIFRDQTRQRQAQEALERSQRDLWNAVQEMERARQQADAARLAKDHFLAVLSHELRTPLTPALLVVQALSRRRDLPTGASEALEMVRRNIQIEAHLIDDLLDLTRIERGKIELTLEEADVHEALNHAIQTVCDDLGKKNQKAIVRLEASDSLILCDITRIQQVFWNILKNASKFSPQGATIVVESKNEAGQIHVIISDPGIGFNEDAAKRIFDAFQQADPEVSRKFGGLGLGLALSRAIVDGHGGEIVAESPGSGLGARFTVQLPIRSSEG